MMSFSKANQKFLNGRRNIKNFCTKFFDRENFNDTLKKSQDLYLEFRRSENCEKLKRGENYSFDLRLLTPNFIPLTRFKQLNKMFNTEARKEFN